MAVDIYQINQTTEQLRNVIKTWDASNPVVSVKTIWNIEEVLRSWTIDMRVGTKKNNSVEQVFQDFFNALYDFILTCKQIDNVDFQNFVENALYEGTLYRYLGHCRSDKDHKTRVEPQYNNIWVSWSKNESNSQLEQKLYSSMTKLTCHTGLVKGIDLKAFGASRPGECEVVYPTYEDCIDNIEYLED